MRRFQFTGIWFLELGCSFKSSELLRGARQLSWLLVVCLRFGALFGVAVVMVL